MCGGEKGDDAVTGVRRLVGLAGPFNNRKEKQY